MEERLDEIICEMSQGALQALLDEDRGTDPEPQWKRVRGLAERALGHEDITDAECSVILEILARSRGRLGDE